MATVSVAKLKTFHPDAETGHYVTVDVILPAGTPSITAKRHRVLVNYLDANNHHFAEFYAQEPSGTQLFLKVGKIDTGAETYLATQSVTGSFGTYPLIVCWDSDNQTLTASVQTASQTLGVSASSTTFGDGKYVGLGAGTGTAGGELFNNFRFWKHASVDLPECPDCEEFSSSPPIDCDCCATNQQPPGTLYVDLGAGGWTDDFCDACNEMSGEVAIKSTPDCTWVYCDGPHCSDQFPELISANFFGIAAKMLRRGPDLCYWRASVKSSPPSKCGDVLYDGGGCAAAAVYESADFFSGLDCRNLNITLTKVSENTGSCTGGTNYCDGAMPNTITLRS